MTSNFFVSQDCTKWLGSVDRLRLDLGPDVGVRRSSQYSQVKLFQTAHYGGKPSRYGDLADSRYAYTN